MGIRQDYLAAEINALDHAAQLDPDTLAWLRENITDQKIWEWYRKDIDEATDTIEGRLGAM